MNLFVLLDQAYLHADPLTVKERSKQSSEIFTPHGHVVVLEVLRISRVVRDFSNKLQMAIDRETVHNYLQSLRLLFHQYYPQNGVAHDLG